MDRIKKIVNDSLTAKNGFFGDDVNVAQVLKASDIMIDRLRSGGKIIVFGNGGSAADSQHMAAELVVRFEKERKALPCIALSTNTSNLTATANDYEFNKIFSRQVEALARDGDVAVAISTSGNSANVLEAAVKAKEKKVPVIALTGRDGGELGKIADVPIIVPDTNTARIQEVHIMIIHIFCKLVEDALS